MNIKELATSKIKIILSDQTRQNVINDRKLQKYFNGLIAILQNEIPRILKNKKFLKGKTVVFSITICGNTTIRKLNRDYRQKDKITDVLSFQMHTEKELAKNNTPVLHLGDIFISLPVAKGQAKSFNITVNEEIIHLIVHGILHLLGLDHELSCQAAKKMIADETILVKRISKWIKDN